MTDLRPRNRWLRLATVVVTLIFIGGGMLAGLALARRLGIEPSELQGPGFVLRPATLSIFVGYQAFQVVVVLLAHRLIHRQPLPLFRLSAPFVRPFTVGLTIGAAVTAAVYAVGVGLSVLLSDCAVEVTWTVPDGTPWWTVLGHYAFFLFVFSFLNAFGEEIAYRVYPVEQFRDRRGWMFVVAMVAALLFASVHFVIGSFSLFWFVGLIGFAALCAALYVRFRSLWLIVGLHAGTTLVDAGLGGAWRMGGLLEMELSAPNGLAFFGSVVVIYSLATVWVLRRAQAGGLR